MSDVTYLSGDRYRRGEIVRLSHLGQSSLRLDLYGDFGTVVADPIKDHYPTQTVIVRWEGKKRSFEINKMFIERMPA
jgi:hypothetical protein